MKTRKNKNYADKALKFFQDEVDDMYIDDQMSFISRDFFLLLFVGGGSYAVYFLTKRHFEENEFNLESIIFGEILDLDKRILNHEGGQPGQDYL